MARDSCVLMSKHTRSRGTWVRGWGSAHSSTQECRYVQYLTPPPEGACLAAAAGQEAGGEGGKERGREGGGKSGMGNTCTSVADSCQCMAKTATIFQSN